MEEGKESERLMWIQEPVINIEDSARILLPKKRQHVHHIRKRYYEALLYFGTKWMTVNSAKLSLLCQSYFLFQQRLCLFLVTLKCVLLPIQTGSSKLSKSNHQKNVDIFLFLLRSRAQPRDKIKVLVKKKR